mmetsp:Transcript_34876/g.62176  ORF Transcript_34876/g.62176 Transcript_34876/m.62176 type:complete len:235 (+) Transcript_34876:243-947(+)
MDPLRRLFLDACGHRDPEQRRPAGPQPRQRHPRPPLLLPHLRLLRLHQLRQRRPRQHIQRGRRHADQPRQRRWPHPPRLAPRHGIDGDSHHGYAGHGVCGRPSHLRPRGLSRCAACARHHGHRLPWRHRRVQTVQRAACARWCAGPCVCARTRQCTAAFAVLPFQQRPSQFCDRWQRRRRCVRQPYVLRVPSEHRAVGALHRVLRQRAALFPEGHLLHEGRRADGGGGLQLCAL